MKPTFTASAAAPPGAPRTMQSGATSSNPARAQYLPMFIPTSPAKFSFLCGRCSAADRWIRDEGGLPCQCKGFAGAAARKRERIARMLLTEPVAMYRKTDGTPVAFEDRCCHRRAPLSRGKVEGDNLR